nr:substrate-binding domain-containing protein [Streptomyces cylindrosporus]
MLAEARLPTVLLGRRSGDEYVSHVDVDNVGGARNAVTHLLKTGSHGHRHHHGAAGHVRVAESDFSEESGRRAMTELLERHPEIDAVLAASDTTAAGALHALRAAGRRVPEDVAVIGFDDFPLAQRTEPRLTKVRQPLEQMGRAMVRLLLEEMEEQPAAWRQVILRTELVVRESS